MGFCIKSSGVGSRVNEEGKIYGRSMFNTKLGGLGFVFRVGVGSGSRCGMTGVAVLSKARTEQMV